MIRIEREDADGNRSPDTTDAVDGDGTDGVVDLDLVEEHDGEHHDDTGDQADDDGGAFTHGVGTGGDADQTGEDAVQGHRQVGLLEHDPGDGDGGHGTGTGGQRGGGEHVGDSLRVGAQGGTAVEAEPAEP